MSRRPESFRMIPKQNTWVLAGKMGAVIITLGAVITSWGSIRSLLERDPLVAVYTIEQVVVSPAMRETWRARVPRQELQAVVSQLEKEGFPPEQILAQIKQRFEQTKTDDNDLQLFGLNAVNRFSWTIQVMNKSDVVLKDVRIAVSGGGRADISDFPCAYFDMVEPPGKWKQEIVLGSIPPHSITWLTVWPEGTTSTVLSPKIGVTYAGGTGVVRELHHFYGWDADLVFWFLEQNAIFRYSAATLPLLVVGGAFWLRRIRKRRQPLPVATSTPSDSGNTCA
jgi:hypothetical protein